jgi:hypothetical protein
VLLCLAGGFVFDSVFEFAFEFAFEFSGMSAVASAEADAPVFAVFAKAGFPLTLPFGPARPVSQYQRLNKNSQSSTIDRDARFTDSNLGGFSDAVVEINRAESR